MCPNENTAACLPRHIAIIMDGNGRWAQRRRRPRVIGHRAGARAADRTINFCLDKGIGALTLFAFSSENWGRPADEVQIGERARFSTEIRQRMEAAEQATAGNQRLVLSVAVSYGGRQDIALAARALAEEVANGQLRPEQIDEAALARKMALADLPPPDLFIRSGGETRISNFLLWQMAYTELWFTETLWPEFDTQILQQALDSYAQRERRFGLTSAQLTAPATQSSSA
jgi:undecaprenyl diphosphate synthase